MHTRDELGMCWQQVFWTCPTHVDTWKGRRANSHAMGVILCHNQPSPDDELQEQLMNWSFGSHCLKVMLMMLGWLSLSWSRLNSIFFLLIFLFTHHCPLIFARIVSNQHPKSYLNKRKAIVLFMYIFSLCAWITLEVTHAHSENMLNVLKTQKDRLK